jgi:SAM-dependent methyltransferase
MQFKDHFSGHAAQYAQARPTYPDALFAQLAALAPARELCWDAGCGNGQASIALGEHFDAVLATDPSAEQIASAAPHPRVRYAVERAEQCSLADASADLVVIAQALHWCDVDAFHREVQRVLKPGGVLAEIGYARTAVSAEVDAVYRRLYDEITGDYWPPERAHVDAHYAGFAFPFDAIALDLPPMQQRWDLQQYLGYLASWSAVARYRKQHGHSPLERVHADFSKAWGEPAQRRDVRWELFARVGRRR